VQHQAQAVQQHSPTTYSEPNANASDRRISNATMEEPGFAQSPTALATGCMTEAMPTSQPSGCKAQQGCPCTQACLRQRKHTQNTSGVNHQRAQMLSLLLTKVGNGSEE